MKYVDITNVWGTFLLSNKSKSSLEKKKIMTAVLLQSDKH